MMGIFKIFTIDNDVKTKIRDSLSAINYPSGTEYEDFIKNSKWALMKSLPDEIVRSLTDMKISPTPPGVVLLRNLPLDDNLPPTPENGLRSGFTKKTSISEAVLIGIMSLTSEVFGYEEEKEGSLVHDVVPQEKSRDALSNEGWEREFGFHTENAFCEHRPTTLGLLCLKSDENAVTSVADIRDALKILSKRDQRQLRMANFQIRTPYVLDNNMPPVWTKPVPVLSGLTSSPEVRVTLYKDGTLPLNIDAKKALSRLNFAFNQIKQDICLDSGDLLLLNGRTTVHKRTGFNPTFDGNQRWLQRSYGLDSFWKHRDCQSLSARLLSIVISDVEKKAS
jgi:L-asparagine oxygenase